MEAKIFEAGLSVRSGIIFGLGGLWEEKKKNATGGETGATLYLSDSKYPFCLPG